MTIHHRTCHICEANCGLLIEMDGDRVLSTRGDPDDVLSRGHICPKGTAIGDFHHDPDRLRAPVRRTADGWEAVSWDDAYADIGARMAALPPNSAALYIGNPTAHDYSIGMQTGALKKALGLRGIYSASTVDQIPHQVVQLAMYGHNSLFPVADIDRTRTMLMLGANPLASNGSVWTAPGAKRRIQALQARGGRLWVVDPRRTETAEIADHHLFIRPGTDSAFLLALIQALLAAGANPGRLTPMLDGLDDALTAIASFDRAALLDWCGVSATDAAALAADMVAGPAAAYGRIGVSTHAFGTLNHWLIQLVNIVTGNLDSIGGAMFTTPGVDVVAQSGRGATGRFTTRVRGVPESIGEFPVVTLAEEIATPGEGQVRALVTVAGNPVLSCPDGGRTDAAFASLDLMVSIDTHVTATTRHAHYILPPCGPLQKDHYPLFLGAIAVRNYAKYSPAILPMGEDRPDHRIVAELARAIAAAKGVAMPPPLEPRAVLDAMLRRSSWGLTLEQVEAAPHGIDLGPLEPNRLPERLFTEDKRIRCAPPAFMTDLDRLRAAMAEPRPALVLIGRRHIRNNNSWMGNVPRLAKGPPRCLLLIHPSDAAARGIADGDTVRIASDAGEVAVEASISDEVMPGVVSLPHGYGHARDGVRLSVARQRPGASHNDLTRTDRIDPLSGNAALTGTPVEVTPLAMAAE